MGEAFKHLLAFIKSDLRVLAIVSISTGAARLFLSREPDLAEGLPTWVAPSLFLFFILSLSAFSVALTLNLLTYVWQKLGMPTAVNLVAIRRRRATKRVLLRLGIWELLVVSIAIAKTDRALHLNPDSPVAISLIRGNIIRRSYSSMYAHSNVSSFEINPEAWQLMLGMEEFDIEDVQQFLRIERMKYDFDMLLGILPQKHPASLRRSKQKK
ncbi:MULTISPECIES: super-infection exclusion protein B [Sulfitobacter]|uniref:super-infection exclusion protein B n=1 Tax=Sulfitobacter TaxID=60136 RepID=UPI00257D8B9F|nr:super-infection exclusion protein B [Sulfitobacter sp. UBA1132]